MSHNKENIVIKKIKNIDKDTFVIFFSYGCYYSEKALEILRKNKLPYKGYDINKINGRMDKILKIFNDNKLLLNFNSEHRTKPIIFLNGNFLGGMTELDNYINKI